MKTFIINSLIIFSLLSYSTTCEARIPLSTALNKPQTVLESIPIEFKRTEPLLNSEYHFAIDNSNRAIPDLLYKNVQMTEYDSVGTDVEWCPLLYRKFTIPNSNNVLAVVYFGGVSPHKTNVLCVVNPNGQILSTLIGSVTYAEITIRQFRIDRKSVV